MAAWLIVWALSAFLAAVGLHAIAPRTYRAEHLSSAARTVAVIALAVAYVAAVWSH